MLANGEKQRTFRDQCGLVMISVPSVPSVPAGCLRLWRVNLFVPIIANVAIVLIGAGE